MNVQTEVLPTSPTNPVSPIDLLQNFTPSAATEKANPSDVRRFLKLQEPGVRELRTTGDRIWNGYYDDPEALARDAIKLSGSFGVTGVFATINPVNPTLLARSYNKMRRPAKGEATSNEDVIRRTTFLVDIDSATRETGICATDAELITAKAKTIEVRNYLRSLGWPEPLIGFSGNGYHLRYEIDLPNDAASNTLLESCLKSLSKFNDANDKVDQKVFDPPRICKIYGTMNAKGDNFLGAPDAPARPHRLCAVISEGTGMVTREQLEILAALAPTQVTSKSGLTLHQKSGTNSKHDWSEPDVETLMGSLELEFDAPESYKGGIRWRLAICPFNPAHTNPDACVFLYPDEDGGHYWTFNCSHDTCKPYAGRTEFKKVMREKFPLADWKETPEIPATSDKSTKVAKPKLSIGVFKYPAIMGGHRDFVLAPLHPDACPPEDGWFPLGDLSGIGGSSGSGKTTLAIETFRLQKNKEKVFGHATKGLSFLILMADRGENANLRTIERMGINPDTVPIKRIKGQGQDALTAIKDSVESCEQIPQIVFVEGADMLQEDSNKINVVAPFITELHELARHYHIALIVSLGSPKMTSKDFYMIRRDQLFGSVAWGRMMETIIILGYDENDDTSAKRVAAVMNHNGPAEKLNLIFEHGVLVEDTTPPEPDEITEWMKEQTEWFSAQDAVKATGKTLSTCKARITSLGGLLDEKVDDGKSHQKRYLIHAAALEWEKAQAQALKGGN